MPASAPAPMQPLDRAGSFASAHSSASAPSAAASAANPNLSLDQPSSPMYGGVSAGNAHAQPQYQSYQPQPQSQSQPQAQYQPHSAPMNFAVDASMASGGSSYSPHNPFAPGYQRPPSSAPSSSYGHFSGGAGGGASNYPGGMSAPSHQPSNGEWVRRGIFLLSCAHPLLL